jgi:hypothetical protein
VWLIVCGRARAVVGIILLYIKVQWRLVPAVWVEVVVGERSEVHVFLLREVAARGELAAARGERAHDRDIAFGRPRAQERDSGGAAHTAAKRESHERTREEETERSERAREAGRASRAAAARSTAARRPARRRCSAASLAV